MDYKDLPPELLEFLSGLKHGSGTLQLDITDAFNNAESVEDAISSSINSLSEIRGEAAHNIEWLINYNKQKEE